MTSHYYKLYEFFVLINPVVPSNIEGFKSNISTLIKKFCYKYILVCLGTIHKIFKGTIARGTRGFEKLLRNFKIKFFSIYISSKNRIQIIQNGFCSAWQILYRQLQGIRGEFSCVLRGKFDWKPKKETFHGLLIFLISFSLTTSVKIRTSTSD